MSIRPVGLVYSQSVHAFLFECPPVNIPDILNLKWIIMHEIPSTIVFWAFSHRLELIASAVFLISHYVSGPWVRFAFLALLASKSNMSESLRHLCDHTCVHCVTYLPLHIFHCAKIESVQTQWTQGQKRLVGARHFTGPISHLVNWDCSLGKSSEKMLETL